jgi:1,4-dihydroxy-2-naphthoate octaprenyltransferase
VAVIAAYLAVVVGVVAGVLPVPTLLMLLTIPLARRVSTGLTPNYDNPYGLMAFMGINVRLHLAAGVLLFAAYVIVIVAMAIAPGVDLFLG